MIYYYSASTGGFYVPEVHGKIIPKDAVKITDGVHAILMAGQARGQEIVADEHGNPVLMDPPSATRLQLQKRLKDAVQAHMDTVARERGYHDIASAVSYAEEPEVPKFQAEGQAFRNWRSRVWAAVFKAFDGPVPTANALIESLPALVFINQS